jgi:ubiquinone biosynthesis monooxygenase Coq6
MAVVDKLHKLYSSTFEPLVCARSVGLEVINELDSVKAAIIMAAGGSAQAQRQHAGSAGWSLAAQGMEALARGITSATAASDMIFHGLLEKWKRRNH